MRKFLLFFAVIVFSALAAAAMAEEATKKEGSQIAWLSSMDQAIEQAKTQNKPILLDFFNPK